MRIGLIQLSPVFGQPGHNLERALSLAAPTRKGDLVLLPELFSTGYQFRSRSEVRDLSEPIPQGPTSWALRLWCRQRGCHVVAGRAESHGGKSYNSAALFGPDGHLGTYRKTHLFREEKRWFAPGNTGFRTWKIPGGHVSRGGSYRVGIMICYDWFFPEACRTLALKGADLIMHPANLVLPWCQEAMVTRALENHVFVATVNRVGEEHRGPERLHFTGGSQIVTPHGLRMLRLGPTGEHAAWVSLSPASARDKRVNPRNDLFRDRRPAYYA